jgi:two-component system cell cycle sensor histidine kinase/response regulator CckA
MDKKLTYEELEMEIKKLNEDLIRIRSENTHLLDRNEICQAIFDNAGVPILLVDAESGKFVEFNRASYESIGYTREEFMELTDRDIIINRDSKNELEKPKLDFSSGSSRLELQVRAKNGEIKDTLVTLKPLRLKDKAYFHHVVMDITEQKKIERELKKSENFSYSILENSPSPIMVINKELKIEYANPTLINLTGFSSEETLGIGVPFPWWDDSAQPIDIETWRENTYKGIRNVEIPFKKKNGERFWIEVSSMPIEKDGEFQHAIIIWIDVTAKKHAQEEERMAQMKYERAQRMESLGTLAGGIAHDFNNLLMGIQGRTSLMLLEKKSHDQDYDHLKGIEDYVKSATSLTRQLLGFARGGKYEVTPVNLNDLLKTNTEMFGRMKKEVNIHKKLSDNLWTCEVDQGQINQVLMNIFVNAWQAMPGGGDLYIESENVDLTEPSLKPYEIKPGRYVRISITDSGIGMDEAVRERIFDPFFTTKEMGRGTGLGLASVYGIIKNHGGFVDVYSEKGKGTTFKLYFPASKKEAVKEETVSEKIIKGNETILLVDDEKLIIDVGKGILERLGYRVFTAENGNEAVEIYRNNKKDIDMVILDMIMPGMNGGKTFDKLKDVDQKVKVLLSSGYSMNGQAIAILEKGCKGFIQKPFDLHALSRKIREILDNKDS